MKLPTMSLCIRPFTRQEEDTLHAVEVNNEVVHAVAAHTQRKVEAFLNRSVKAVVVVTLTLLMVVLLAKSVTSMDIPLTSATNVSTTLTKLRSIIMP